MSDHVHNEYKCPFCGRRMTLDIEPGKRIRMAHAAPPCDEAAGWKTLVDGAVVELSYPEFGERAPCEHVWIESSTGAFCDKCGEQHPDVQGVGIDLERMRGGA